MLVGGRIIFSYTNRAVTKCKVNVSLRLQDNRYDYYNMT